MTKFVMNSMRFLLIPLHYISFLVLLIMDNSASGRCGYQFDKQVAVMIMDNSASGRCGYQFDKQVAVMSQLLFLTRI